MTKALTRTLKLLELNRIDRDIYTWNGKSVGFQRIFGGQIMAQCLVAAYQTVEKKRTAHSFHSYFLRPGDFNQNIIFDVGNVLFTYKPEYIISSLLPKTPHKDLYLTHLFHSELPLRFESNLPHHLHYA